MLRPLDPCCVAGLGARSKVATFTLFQALTAKWQDLGISGRQAVRDPWRQQDLGVFDGVFKAAVSRHGVVLVRMRPADGTKRED